MEDIRKVVPVNEPNCDDIPFYGSGGRRAAQVAKELDIPLEVYKGGMDSSRSIIEHIEGPEVDVFISRGGTSAHIAQNCNVPVVNITTGLYDIMESCEEARKISRNIAITSFGKPFVGMRLLEKAMDIVITEVVFHSLTDLEARIAELAEEGRFCVVGGGQSVPAAQKMRTAGSVFASEP